MKAARIYLLFHVFLITSVLVNAFDPITTAVTVGICASLGRTIYNYFHERCDSKWIAFNVTGKHGVICHDVYVLTL